MKLKYFFLIICIIFNLIIAQDAKVILYKTMNRLTDIDQSYTIKLEEVKGDKTKYKEFSILHHWPSDSVIMKNRYQILEPDNMRGVVVWEFRNSNYNVIESWMTMPVTGKLKNITKQATNESFDFGEAMMLSSDMIENHSNKIIGSEFINGYDCVIIESSLYKEKKIKSIKKLWIDQSQNLIHKIEYYNRRGRLNKTIQYTDFIIIDKILIPSKGIIKNKKKKMITYMVIENFSFDKIDDTDLLTPKAGLLNN